MEQSLQLLDDALEEMRTKLADVDDQTQLLVRQLAHDSQVHLATLESLNDACHDSQAHVPDA